MIGLLVNHIKNILETLGEVSSILQDVVEDTFELYVHFKSSSVINYY